MYRILYCLKKDILRKKDILTSDQDNLVSSYFIHSLCSKYMAIIYVQPQRYTTKNISTDQKWKNSRMNVGRSYEPSGLQIMKQGKITVLF